jgi:hypothetical protein
MKPQCIQAVQAVAQKLGRNPLTKAQIAAVDTRIAATMRMLARTEEGWQGLSPDARVQMAAERALEDIQAEAARKVANAELQVLKTASIESRITDLQRLSPGDKRAQALVSHIEESGHYIQGVKMDALTGMLATMDGAKSGDGAGIGRRLSMFFFDVENPQMTRDIATEIWGNGDGGTGNKVAQEGAKAWLQTIETLRQRFNSAGGDVRKLDYGYLPQPHDQARVRDAGQVAWVAKTLPLLDRSRYVDEAGARLNDAEVSTILAEAWNTVSTDGMNKMEPGGGGSGSARANRGSESRQIHFKDADSFLGYMQEFGRGSMYDAMVGHIGALARDIGLVERYGPNPNAQMRLQFDLAAKADGTSVDNLPRTFGLRPQSYWDLINGTASSPASAKLAQIGTDMRNIQVFGKLGGAVISSITDLGTYFVTTGYNRLGYWNAMKNIASTAKSKGTRDFLNAHGIIAEGMIGDLNRWTTDNIKQNWSGRLANTTMKLSLMNAWTDTLRRSFSLTMMQGLARMSKTEWGKLSEWDRTHLERRGLTEADWQQITKAELTHFRDLDHLTPEAIRAGGGSDQLVSKVLGLIQDESEYAVMNPDLATKGFATGGATRAGTVNGEIARSVMQFKSFPIAMISRHWRRVLDAPRVEDGSGPAFANRTLYMGALMVSTTALGAIALQTKQIVQGKDPMDMTGKHAGKFWAKAVAQGGGLSIVGDTLLNDPGSDPTGFAKNMGKTLFGPSAGTIIDAAAIGVGNAWDKASGRKTNVGAETVNLLRSNAPVINLWYAKSAIDHAGLHALQENLSPGYLSKMKQRAKKDWGQDYWWEPGTGAPDRGPDIERAVGQ